MVEAAAELLRHAERSKAPPPRGSEMILVVEDHALLREVTRDFFQTSGYNVIPAGSPDPALQLARRHNGPIDCL